eukprot:scaffold36747_cov63-Phaeocystis_antarctica.AAC.4
MGSLGAVTGRGSGARGRGSGADGGGSGARGRDSGARGERFVPRATAVIDGPAPPTLDSSSPGRLGAHLVRVVLGSIGGPVPALAPGGSGEHTGQIQSPSGMVCSGGTRHCWWKERPQSGLSQRRMSLPAQTSPEPHSPHSAVPSTSSCCCRSAPASEPHKKPLGEM